MSNSHNPLDMLQGMWGQLGFQLPGMVAPTLDEGDLEKQIADLRSVENWLRMNLSMLQMTIQNLEMQKTTLGTFRSVGQHFTNTASGTESPIPTTLKSFFGNLGDAVAAATSAPQATAKASATPAKAGAKKPAAKKTGKPATKKTAAPRKAGK